MSRPSYKSKPRASTLRLEPLPVAAEGPVPDRALEHLAEAFRLVDGLYALGEWPPTDGRPGAILAAELAAALDDAAEATYDFSFAAHLAQRATAVETLDFADAFAFGASREMPFELMLGPTPSYILPRRDAGIAATLGKVRSDPVLDELELLDSEIAGLARHCLQRSGAAFAGPSFAPPLYSVCDLFAVAGAAAAPPFHFAHFLPEDEGIDGVTTKTVVYRNLYLLRFSRISLPLLRALGDPIDESRLLAAAPRTLLRWLRTHDMAHAYFDRTCLSSGIGGKVVHAARELLSDLLADALILSDDDGRGQRIVLAEKLRCARRDATVFADALAARAQLAWLQRELGDPIDARPDDIAHSSLDLIVQALAALSRPASGFGIWLERMAGEFVDVTGAGLIDDVVPLLPTSPVAWGKAVGARREWVRA